MAPYPGKRFRHPFWNRCYERYLRLRKPTRAFLSALLRKGRRAQTIMLVPHSEKNVIQLRISNFALLLSLALLLVVVAFSVMALNQREADQTRLRSLSQVSRNHNSVISNLKAGTDRTVACFRLFSSQMRHLSSHVEPQKKTRIFPNYPQGGVSIPVSSLEREETVDASRELHIMGYLDSNLQKSAARVRKFNRLLTRLKKVMRDIPCGWPVVGGGRMVSPYGYRDDPITGENRLHTGVDILWWPGSPIRATADGIVENGGEFGNYGICVVLRHKYGYVTRYAHLVSSRVKKGRRVKRGEIVGFMGSTGRSIAPHLHYEVLLDEQAIDPEPYLMSKFP